jgi:transcriptional regulator with XRE-family HTH domain
MSFGQHLWWLREGAGLSRAELARRAGVPASSLHSWEGNRGFPGLHAFRRLVAALGVTPERLTEGVEDPAKDKGGGGGEEACRQRKRRAP